MGQSVTGAIKGYEPDIEQRRFNVAEVKVPRSELWRLAASMS